MANTTLESRAPVDNLVRARHDIGTVELRSEAEGGNVGMTVEQPRHGLAQRALAEAVDHPDLVAVGERGLVQELVDLR